jgi:hypothetical protein
MAALPLSFLSLTSQCGLEDNPQDSNPSPVAPWLPDLGLGLLSVQLPSWSGQGGVAHREAQRFRKGFCFSF